MSELTTCNVMTNSTLQHLDIANNEDGEREQGQIGVSYSVEKQTGNYIYCRVFVFFLFLQEEEDEKYALVFVENFRSFPPRRGNYVDLQSRPNSPALWLTVQCGTAVLLYSL